MSPILDLMAEQPPLATKTLQILLVEDNPADARIVQECLKQSGLPYDLTVQEDGERAIEHIEAVEKGAARKPDLVLLDINLPRRNGFEVLKHVRAVRAWSSVPVVIVSCSVAMADVAKARELSATDFFHKPMSFTEFMDGLVPLVRKYGSLQLG